MRNLLSSTMVIDGIEEARWGTAERPTSQWTGTGLDRHVGPDIAFRAKLTTLETGSLTPGAIPRPRCAREGH